MASLIIYKKNCMGHEYILLAYNSDKTLSFIADWKKKVLQQEPLNMSPYKYNLLGVKNDIYVDTLEIFPWQI